MFIRASSLDKSTVTAVAPPDQINNSAINAFRDPECGHHQYHGKRIKQADDHIRMIFSGFLFRFFRQDTGAGKKTGEWVEDVKAGKNQPLPLSSQNFFCFLSIPGSSPTNQGYFKICIGLFVS
jgi:hypothetical protein